MTLPVTTWTVAALGLLAYMVGGIPMGLVLVRLTRPLVDVRSLGTGNIGTSNIYRNVDAGLAVVVGPLQFLQGFLPVLLAGHVGMPAPVVGLCALCAVIAGMTGTPNPANALSTSRSDFGRPEGGGLGWVRPCISTLLSDDESSISTRLDHMARWPSARVE